MKKWMISYMQDKTRNGLKLQEGRYRLGTRKKFPNYKDFLEINYFFK